MVSEPRQPFQTLREILRHVLGLHLKALQQYETELQQRQDARERAVLSHLRDSEKALAAAVARYEQSGDEVLDTYVQGVPFAIAEANAAVGGDMEAMLAGYRTRNAALLELYEQLEASVGPRAQAILADFVEQERRQQQRLQHALLDF
jgi:hypothetical protein